MNEVQIDDQRLTAELDAAIASAPVDDAAPGQGGELVQVEAEKWGPFLGGMLKTPVFGMVIPQWQIEKEMQDEWFGALGECMDQVFPGGPAGKYACWARLVCGTTVIVGMTVVNNGGKLPPLGPKKTGEQIDASANTENKQTA